MHIYANMITVDLAKGQRHGWAGRRRARSPQVLDARDGAARVRGPGGRRAGRRRVASRTRPVRTWVAPSSRRPPSASRPTCSSAAGSPASAGRRSRADPAAWPSGADRSGGGGNICSVGWRDGSRPRRRHELDHAGARPVPAGRRGLRHPAPRSGVDPRPHRRLHRCRRPHRWRWPSPPGPRRRARGWPWWGWRRSGSKRRARWVSPSIGWCRSTPTDAGRMSGPTGWPPRPTASS